MRLVDENQIKAVTARGIEIVVKAISMHIENPDTCKNGFCVLMNMACNGKKVDWNITWN